MERLTEWYDNGISEGVLVKEKRGEKEIKVLFKEIDDGYIGMCTLKAYEDTGLTPEQIREIDRLYAEKCRELAKLRQRDTAKRPEKSTNFYDGFEVRNYVCPTCGKEIADEGIIEKIDYRPEFCSDCGQRLKWGKNDS